MSDPYEITINNLSTNEFSKLTTFVENIQTDMEEDGKPFYITATNDESRTSAQNRLLWSAYYPAIADKMGEKDEELIAARCKRKFGVPLMKTQAYAAKPTKRSKDVKRELLRFGLIDHDEQTIKDSWVTLMSVLLFPMDGQMDAFKLLDCTKNFTTKLFAEYINRIEIWAAQELGLNLESINKTLRDNALNIK